MSAKKRGPGRPPKSKNKKKPAASSAPARNVHTVPSHFWSQVGAIILAVVTAMLVAGLFGMGGELPVGFANAVRWLVGWTAFVIPVVFAVQIIQVFKQPEDRIPAVIWVTTVIFLALFAGTFQLALPDPTSLELAQAGNGGGTVGWAVADVALGFVNVPIAALIFVTLMLILLMFIFSISPGAVVQAIHDFIGHEAAEDEQNAKVAAALASDDGKIKVGGLGKGEIKKDKPAEDEAVDDDGKKRRRRLLGRHKDDEEGETEEGKSQKDAKAVPHDLEVSSVNKIEKAEPAIIINNSNWKLPDVKELSNDGRKAEPGNIKLRAQQIESTLAEFGIGGNVRKVNVGPRVTQYCLEPQRGIPLSRITSLQDKFALNMQVESLRIEAPIPGQPYVGIEIPNKRPASVNLRTILESKEWAKQQSPLAFAVGLNITGEPIVADLASLEMPHLLVAGTTGSGKSVMMNVMVMSMLFRNTPDDLKFVLVDPKGNEMSSYKDMPHLAAPVISGTSAEELHKLTKTLLWVTEEMDRRYQVFGSVKKISDFRKKFPDEKMPYIVVIIDEYTDIIDSLKSTERETVTTAVQRIAQKGRAAGIHEVIMMQAPRAKYIQGPLKANIPAGFAFMVRSKMESQQIINQSGAETLMGQGDMLMLTGKLKNPRRIQSAFVDDAEVEQIVTELKMQSGPQYDETLLARLSDDTPVGGGTAVPGAGGDSMYNRAVQLVIESGRCSTSYLQRRLGIGFSRASRIVDEMEEHGIVGPANGSKPREVLVSSVDELEN